MAPGRKTETVVEAVLVVWARERSGRVRRMEACIDGILKLGISVGSPWKCV
jgi:hypothetical protein